MTKLQPQSSRSPPRRARPVPQIPSPFLSPNFSAAVHALQLIDEPQANIQSTLSSLRILRDQISNFLHSTAPQWHTLSPAIASLHYALHTTQSATQLRTSLTAMQTSPPARANYPAEMASVVHRTAQLSANVALASAVRDFAQLLSAAQVPEAIVFPSSYRQSTSSTASARRATIHPLPQGRNSPSISLPDRFLQRAAAFNRARIAATTTPLADVPGLDDIRASLTRHHSALQAQLESVLIDAIFLPVISSSLETAVNVEGPRTFVPLSPPEATAALHSSIPQSTLPSLVQAIDLLGGPNHSALVLRDAAYSSLMMLVRDSLVADPVLSPSTITSTGLSSSTTPSPVSKRPQAFSNSSVEQPMLLLDSDTFHSSRLRCAAVFERVCAGMIAVLRRLSGLAESIDCEDSTIFDAVHHVWQCMERMLISFVHAVLDFPSLTKPQIKTGVSALVDAATLERHPKCISLLPSTSRKSPRPSAETTAVSWELERLPASVDCFTGLVQNLTSLTPSIYHLEVAYSPLQQFIMMSTRLQHSWRERDGAHMSPTTPPSPSALSQVLVRAVDLFMRTVRLDVCKYMQSVLGKRAGTLLQPLSRRQRHGRLGLSNCGSLKDKKDLKNGHRLPLLPQTQSIIKVIASCLAIGVSVPTIASRIGEVINREIILPLCERAAQALDLASTWSDGGVLFSEMWRNIVDKNGIIENGETGAHLLKRESDDFKLSGRILALMRRERGLAVNALEKLCGHEVRRVCNTCVLMENEWKAVVRLVSNAKIIISELESCVGKTSVSGIYANGFGSDEIGDTIKLVSLREILEMRGISSNLYGPVVEAIQQSRSGCQILREEVIDRGLILLHCEIVLLSFSRVVKTLSVDAIGDETSEGHSDLSKLRAEFGDGSDVFNGKYDGSKGTINGYENDKGTSNASGLSKPSSIFKALPIHLSDVERTSDEESGGINEFDEFGDRITIANDNVTDTDIEECGFPNSLLLEPGDWKDSEDEGGPRKTGMLSKGAQTVTKSDKRALEDGQAFGEIIKTLDNCARQNLGSEDGKYVLREVDESVGLGIRMSGEIRVKGDRDVATGARLFLDATASAAGETLGWPIVESDYSVAEGASHSGSECRTLLYAAGML